MTRAGSSERRVRVTPNPQYGEPARSTHAVKVPGQLTSSLPRFVPLPSFLPPRPVPVPAPPPAPPDPLPPAPFLLPAAEEDAA